MKEILPGSVKLIDEPGKEFCCEQRQRQRHTQTHTQRQRETASATRTHKTKATVCLAQTDTQRARNVSSGSVETPDEALVFQASAAEDAQ
eukprot:COSAG06_NODE_562_length_14275_cov_28.599041_16_plen_90_part_00